MPWTTSCRSRWIKRNSCGTGIHTCFWVWLLRKVEQWHIVSLFCLSCWISQLHITKWSVFFAVGKAEWNFVSRYLTKSSEKEPSCTTAVLVWELSGDTFLSKPLDHPPSNIALLFIEQLFPFFAFDMQGASHQHSMMFMFRCLKIFSKEISHLDSVDFPSVLLSKLIDFF